MECARACARVLCLLGSWWKTPDNRILAHRPYYCIYDHIESYSRRVCHPILCHSDRFRSHLNLEDSISGPSKITTYIEPEVWQGLSTEQHRTIMQAREKKSHEQVGVKKPPYVPRKAGKARRAKAAKARRAIAAKETQATDDVWQAELSQCLRTAVNTIQAKEMTEATHEDMTAITSNVRTSKSNQEQYKCCPGSWKPRWMISLKHEPPKKGNIVEDDIEMSDTENQ